jgi:hypothetical protein
MEILRQDAIRQTFCRIGLQRNHCNVIPYFTRFPVSE